MVIVFSGFRDDALKAQIEDAGGRVAVSLVKTATHLLLKKEGKPSKKVEEAKEKGLELVFLDDFLEEYEFTLGVKEKKAPKEATKSDGEAEDPMLLMAKVMVAFATKSQKEAALAALDQLRALVTEL